MPDQLSPLTRMREGATPPSPPKTMRKLTSQQLWTLHTVGEAGEPVEAYRISHALYATFRGGYWDSHAAYCTLRRLEARGLVERHDPEYVGGQLRWTLTARGKASLRWN